MAWKALSFRVGNADQPGYFRASMAPRPPRPWTNEDASRATSLKWWFLFCASAIGFGSAWYAGLVSKLWDIDQTKLSFVIIGLYFLISPFIGWITWRRERGYAVGQLLQHIDALEEASDLMMKLAIMGTTLGFFIVITSTFAGGAGVNQQLIVDAVKGLGIIYLVTFVGVLCSSLLNLQLVNLRYAVAE